jgi:hypothetical protein
MFFFRACLNDRNQIELKIEEFFMFLFFMLNVMQLLETTAGNQKLTFHSKEYTVYGTSIQLVPVIRFRSIFLTLLVITKTD